MHFWGIGKRWSPRQDSNLNRPLRRRVHYPLCYGEGRSGMSAVRGAMVTVASAAGGLRTAGTMTRQSSGSPGLFMWQNGCAPFERLSRPRDDRSAAKQSQRLPT